MPQVQVDTTKTQKIAQDIPFESALSATPSLPADFDRYAEPVVGDNVRRVFDIHVADGDDQRDQAGILVDRMYATRGYLSNGLSRRANDRRITLVASEAGVVVGTLTLGFDRASGLLVDELFRSETEPMRDAGLVLCEFTKLAIDGAMRSRRLIASLFHAAYLYAHPIMGSDRLLIEVNPRHVGYYRRMLGFQTLGRPRENPRVHAPAVLMALDLEHARREIDAVAGSAFAGPVDTRSLYPFFFARHEEQAILERAERNIATNEPIRAARPPRADRRVAPARHGAFARTGGFAGSVAHA